MRFLSECTSQESPLLLAAGKGADLALAEFRQFHRFKSLFDRLTILFAKASPPSQGLVPSHLNHSAHRDREIPVDRCALWQIGDGLLGHALAIAMETHRSGFQWNQADKRLEK